MKMSMKHHMSLFAALCLILVASPLFAEEALHHRVALSGGFDARIRPDPGGHGFGLVDYTLEGLPADSRLNLSYNTDTLRLRFDRVRFANGVLEAGLHVDYEFVFAGLLPDYFRDGRLDSTRGFNAGYLLFGGHIKANLPRDNYLEVGLGGRRWFFARNDQTDQALTLPPETWVVEGRLRYTFWRIRSDPSLAEAHRLFSRVRGAAFGVEVGLDRRVDAAPFGALDEETFDPVDRRNSGEESVFLFRQWLRAGAQITSVFRVQVSQSAGFGQGEDDLTRVRIGGMNPYVVQLAGAPWASLLASTFIAAQLSFHFNFYRDLELGFLLDGVALEDQRRQGEQDMGMLGGVGLFFDLRFGAFQVDIRGGWTPSLGVDVIGSWNAYVGFGWQWQNR